MYFLFMKNMIHKIVSFFVQMQTQNSLSLINTYM